MLGSGQKERTAHSLSLSFADAISLSLALSCRGPTRKLSRVQGCLGYRGTSALRTFSREGGECSPADGGRRSNKRSREVEESIHVLCIPLHVGPFTKRDIVVAPTKRGEQGNQCERCANQQTVDVAAGAPCSRTSFSFIMH